MTGKTPPRVPRRIPMQVFLKEVQYANASLLEAVWREQDQVKAIREGLRQLEARRGTDLAAQIEETLQRLQAHETSIGALAGAVLQIAHSGIRLAHGGRQGCPSGRVVVGTFGLRDVIWQARNQAAHWEDELHEPTREVFEALRKADNRFDAYLQRNMAFNVISFLGWTSETDVSKDLLSLS